MSGTIKGNAKRIARISRLYKATETSATDVAQQNRFLRARRSAIGTNQPTAAGLRAGEILLSHRPVFLLDTPPFDPDAAQLAELAPAQADLVRVAKHAAPSVGLVEVWRDNAFQPIGTCFRVAGGASRIVTSGHLMRDILAKGTQIRRGYEYRSRPSEGQHLQTRVRFPGGTFSLATILCAHPVWDLMVADLTPAAAAIPPLEIESDLDATGLAGDLVAVVGFPLAASDVTQPDELEIMFAGKLGRQCVAPGRASPLSPVTRPLPDDFSAQDLWLGHDATTLPGNSGSPVISLSTGRVVAVHGLGGQLNPFDRTAIVQLNGGVPLPLVCAEEEAMRVLILGTQANPPPLPRNWFNPVPPWTPRGESVPSSPRSAAVTAIRPDRSDFRDFPYRPSLMRPLDQKLPDTPSGTVWDQQGEASCVGCALATAIGEQLAALGREETVVSPRMLYEAAREHDEFLDDGKGGTSLRGAIKGFFHNGVCLESKAPYRPGETNWSLDIENAVQAGDVALGAYYKVEPRLSDTQLAICEAGAVVVSARIHRNWLGKLPDGRIPFRPGSIGTHAFVLLGYDHKGFILQNSWGEKWGLWNDQPGLAHWSYDDWAENILDTWVMRLAPRAPGTLDLRARAISATAPSRPRRSSILGHVVQTEQHGIVRSGGLSPGLASLRETAVFLASKVEGKDKKPRDGTKYSDLAIFLHDPFLDADEPGQLVKALVEPFKKQKIYPFHIFHGLDAARSFMARMQHESQSASDRYRLSGEELTSWLNSRAPAAGAGVLAMISEAAAAAARSGGAVHEALCSLLSEILATKQQRRVHLIGLGLGSVIAQELARPGKSNPIPVASLTLVDPVGAVHLAARAIAQTRGILPGHAALHGYRGTWTSLARATLGGREPITSTRDRLAASTITEAASNGSLASFVLASLQ
jgi:hypothetical protein